MSPPTNPIVVIIGVSGAGKTTVGKALAVRLGSAFMDADDLHPRANIEKMKSGRPLDDADRAPWLAKVRDWIDQQRAEGRSGVIACSALKRRYRRDVAQGCDDVRLVWLEGPRALLEQRLAGRKGHFMPVALLGSQLADFEPPGAGEAILTISIAPPVDQIVSEILKALRPIEDLKW